MTSVMESREPRREAFKKMEPLVPLQRPRDGVVAIASTLRYKVNAMLALLKRPSAYIPLAMSSVVLALILVRVARFGIAREADEGAEAHLFQILMPAQLPIIALFAVRWLPRGRREALEVLALQGAAALAVFGTVFFLRW